MVAAGKALVFQSGGPTRVINRSLRGVVESVLHYIKTEESAGRTPAMDCVYGSMNGVRGIIDENLIDLTNTDYFLLRRVSRTPASALGTTRYELVEKKGGAVRVKQDDVDKAMRVLKAHNVRYVFTIGGGDSSETAQVLRQTAEEKGYELCVMHVPKTIDNDLLMTDHCPGYGSAATFVIHTLLGSWYDAMAFGNSIDLKVIMGRNAGWLTSAAAYCRNRGVRQLIVTPEHPMEIDEFVEAVREAYAENDKLLQIALSEGARGGNGEWATLLADGGGMEIRTDATGRKLLSDVGLAKLLAPKLKEATGARVVQDTLGYPQRSFLGVYSETDAREAEWAGIKAVEFALKGESGKMVGIERLTGRYNVGYRPVELSEVAQPGRKLIRVVPSAFFDGNGQPNDAFVEWLEPLLGGIPPTEEFEGRPVSKLVTD